MSSICELFHHNVTSLCTPPKDTDSGVEYSHLAPQFSSALLFSAVDALILHAGYSLSEDHKSRFEQSIYKALLSMLKGIYCIKLPNNRKMRRSQCESFRVNFELQKLLLRMAYHFVCTAHRQGMSSFIVSVLKQCCENAIGVISLSATATEILCSLDVLTMPTSVVIPSSTLLVALQDKIIEQQRSQGEYFAFV